MPIEILQSDLSEQQNSYLVSRHSQVEIGVVLALNLNLKERHSEMLIQNCSLNSRLENVSREGQITFKLPSTPSVS